MGVRGNGYFVHALMPRGRNPAFSLVRLFHVVSSESAAVSYKWMGTSVSLEEINRHWSMLSRGELYEAGYAADRVGEIADKIRDPIFGILAARLVDLRQSGETAQNKGSYVLIATSTRLIGVQIRTGDLLVHKYYLTEGLRFNRLSPGIFARQPAWFNVPPLSYWSMRFDRYKQDEPHVKRINSIGDRVMQAYRTVRLARDDLDLS